MDKQTLSAIEDSRCNVFLFAVTLLLVLITMATRATADAQNNYEFVTASVQAALRQPYNDSNDPRLAERRARIANLFGTLSVSDRRQLLVRLENPVKNDALARLFHRKLG